MKIVVENGWKRNEIFTGENKWDAMKSEVKNVAKKAVASAMRNAVKNEEEIEWVKKFFLFAVGFFNSFSRTKINPCPFSTLFIPSPSDSTVSLSKMGKNGGKKR